MTLIEKLQKPLTTEEIDFRIQSINQGKYATILAYKDARADMNRLDEVFGVFGWKREHSRDNKNCTVSVWDDENKQWVSKEDTGTESNTEAEKGLASDSFKRACFNLGIGRELYDYPVISIKLNDNEVVSQQGKFRPSFELNLRQWNWKSEFENNKIISLYGYDVSGKERFSWRLGQKAKTIKTEANQENLKTTPFTEKEIEVIGLKIIACKNEDELKELYHSDIRIKTHKGLCKQITERKLKLS